MRAMIIAHVHAQPSLRAAARVRVRRGLGALWVAGLALGAAALASPAGAAGAEACPGAGRVACPYSAVQVIGQRGEGVLRFPEAVAVDTQGDVYVADQLSYLVQKFTAAGAFETQWGSYGGGHGQFGPIGGLAVDAAGAVYVVDSSHDRIEKFGPNGEFITEWGRRGSALGDFNFGSSQKPNQPPGGGIAVAGLHVYVTDSGNDRVERFNLQGGEALAWGTKGSGPGQLSYPRGIAANESEVIVADDDNHRLERFTDEGIFEAESGTQGTGAGQFNFPYGVALDAAGNVYVADDSNDRIVKLTPELSFDGAWGGPGSKPGQLDFPRALAADPAGETFVADTANDRIQVFSAEGELLRGWGASGRGPGQLTGPRGLAVDPTGRLLVSDTVDGRLEIFAPEAGPFSEQWTLAGEASTGFSSPEGIGVDPRGSVYVADTGHARIVHAWGEGAFLGEIAAGTGQLDGAGALAVSSATGQVYVADTGHNRVLVYGPEGALEQRWGAGEGNGAAGASAGQFDHPDALAIAPSGDVYVADTANNRVVELSSAGAVITEWGDRGTGNGHFRTPDAIAVGAAGQVYVLDYENNRVQVFDGAGHFLAKWGLRGIGAGEFSQPTAIAVGCEGDVYVADTNNNRVERFDVGAAGTGCLQAGSWPPPVNLAPVLQLGLARAGGVLAARALTLSLACKRTCKVLVTGTLTPLRRRGAVSLVAVAHPLGAGSVWRGRLRLGPNGLRRLRRELGRRRGLRARVQIVAEGPTGLRTTLTRSFMVTR